MVVLDLEKDREKKRGSALSFYLRFGFFLVLVFGVTGTMGTLQHTRSHGTHPHGSSTTTTTPHSGHLYLAPFCIFAIL
jgi:hypothetical protein